jgi:16S rRNA (guanine(966)-N(2))-methyltransferase RsmD
MRIIGGRFRRRQLAGPRGRGVRPTSDRLRETLFNVLGTGLEGARVLDGFGGTGALGLEALSRGAAEAVLVESDPAALGVIAENIRRCGAEAGSRVVRGRYPEAARAAGPFDVVLLDPPYDAPALDDLVAAADTMLVPSGLVVLEHSRRRPSPDAAGALARVRVLTAGDSALSFYRRAAAEPPPSP